MPRLGGVAFRPVPAATARNSAAAHRPAWLPWEADGGAENDGSSGDMEAPLTMAAGQCRQHGSSSKSDESSDDNGNSLLRDNSSKKPASELWTSVNDSRSSR